MRDVDPMLAQCRPTFCDAGPASKQHRHKASRLLGRDLIASPRRVSNAGAMQARRLRRRARIKPTIAQCLALAVCRGGPTLTHYGGLLSCQRCTDTLHQLADTYLQSTTPANADAQQVRLRCRARLSFIFFSHEAFKAVKKLSISNMFTPPSLMGLYISSRIIKSFLPL